MTEWWRPLARLLQRAESVPVAARLTRSSYRAAAQVAAWLFESLPHVNAVYLTGSGTRPERLRPGQSDIDLVLTVDTPTLAAELELRRALRRMHGGLHAMVPAFTNLDYIESRDLDLLRRVGNAWALDLDHRWVPLAGRSELHARPPSRPRAERNLLHLAWCLKRWMKSSGLIAGMEDEAATRNAQRLLADVLAGYSDADRLAPLPELLARAKSIALPTLTAMQEDTPPSLESCLAASFEVLDLWARERTESWDGAWRVRGETDEATCPPETMVVGQELIRAGCTGAFAVPRGTVSGGWLLFGVTGEGSPPADALLGVRRGLLGSSPLPDSPFPWVRHPVLFTASMWRAAALLSPEPFVGAAASVRAVPIAGKAPELPPCPPAPDLAAVVRARMLRHLVRRIVRSRRGAATWERERTFETCFLLPALEILDREGIVDLRCATSAALDDAEHIRRLRDWADARRPALARASRLIS